MGVEQDGLGGFEVLRVFYEIKAGFTSCGIFIKRDARGPHEGSACLKAHFRRFIAMKLQQSHWYLGAGSYYFRSAFINEKQHGGDERR